MSIPEFDDTKELARIFTKVAAKSCGTAIGVGVISLLIPAAPASAAVIPIVVETIKHIVDNID